MPRPAWKVGSCTVSWKKKRRSSLGSEGSSRVRLIRCVCFSPATPPTSPMTDLLDAHALIRLAAEKYGAKTLHPAA